MRRGCRAVPSPPRMRLINFFFYRYADPPDLHSFPTRRSSDLTCSPSRSAHSRPRESTCSSWRDRKSTRLNSSHRCISYAVFCLKKKKYITHAAILVKILRYTNTLPNHFFQGYVHIYGDDIQSP